MAGAAVSAALILAGLDSVVKIIGYFLYDKIWAKLKYGRHLLKSEGCCIWMTGLSGSGKSTVAEELVRRLEARLRRVEYLDGDVVRASFCGDLGFSKADRDENIRRISYVASYLSKHAITICSFISPYREARAKARNLTNNFIEVHIDCPLEVCEARDVKGLYAKVRAGEIGSFTGIHDDAPYEAPEGPEICLKTDEASLDECVEEIVVYLEQRNLI
jgi:adenylylsulfate kinase